MCPPIPGRADYIHHIADLLGENNLDSIPVGEKITCLDIGVGASCIYPIIGVTEYGWNFIGSDINPNSIESSKSIIASNPSLKDKVTFRLQENSKDVFYHILTREDKIDATICNPPFHASIEDAQRGTKRKVQNLSGNKVVNSGKIITEENRYAQFLDEQGVLTPFVVDHFTNDKHSFRANYRSMTYNKKIPDKIFVKPGNTKKLRKKLKL